MAFTEAQRKAIFLKTQGRCHFCGDKLDFEKYDIRKDEEPESWNIDHLHQKDKGGAKGVENCLPVHVTCNRSRWNYEGGQLRDLLLLGQIANSEIKKKIPAGRRFSELRARHLDLTQKRRRPAKNPESADIDPNTEI